MVRGGRAYKGERKIYGQTNGSKTKCSIMEGKGRNVESVTKKKRNFQHYKIMLRGEVRLGLNHPLDVVTGRPRVNLMKVLWVE